MTVPNPDPSHTFASQRRPLLVSFFAHVVIGYSLYFVALMQAEPPVWAIDYIEQLKPTLGALETAARLSDRPFPAQVMILYTVISSILLGMYWVCYIFWVKHIRHEMYRRCCEKWQQPGFRAKERLQIAGIGVAELYVFGYGVPIHYFVEGGMVSTDNIHWLGKSLFSSSILSTTLLLVLSVLTGVAFVIGPLGVYLSISRFKTHTPLRS